MCLSWQTHVCHDKTRLLLWQNYACHDKTFVATNIFFSQQIFVATNIILLWQDKLTFVMTKHIFCHDKSMLVMTKRLSWQKTCFMFVATSFVTTKIILVAAPTNDRHLVFDLLLYLDLFSVTGHTAMVGGGAGGKVQVLDAQVFLHLDLLLITDHTNMVFPGRS